MNLPSHNDHGDAGDLEAIAQVKRMADERVYQYVERGAMLGKIVYGVVGAIILVTLYVGRISWTLGEHSVYIRELKESQIRNRLYNVERHLKGKDGYEP